MERDIDMGQTIEEAARIERERIILELHADYKIHGDARHYVISSTVIGKYGVNLFKAGAEWQAKQSPWISVKDRLPPPGEEVLLFDINSIRHLVLGWLRENKGYNKSMWALSNGHVDDEDITHWMRIPKNHG